MALPPEILIVGGGVFGLSTALSLTKRHPDSQITLIESSPTIPNPEGSSVDTSRIVRADYASAAYSRLAVTAIKRWQNSAWGEEGRYAQNGLLLVYPHDNASARKYALKSYENVKRVDSKNVEFLHTKDDILRLIPGYADHLDVEGGYVNWGSGWSDAAAGVRFAKGLLDREGKVRFLTGDVQRVIYDTSEEAAPRATGVALADGSIVSADLIILTTGAWTPKLVDLRGRAIATGQAIAYMRISDAEQQDLEHLPTLLNFATGIFIIPPRDNVLKIARHAYGYRNPTTVPIPGPVSSSSSSPPTTNTAIMQISLPEKGVPAPLEAQDAFRTALQQLLPRFAERPFTSTRVCWYTDTPRGDFIISYHPKYKNLFLATGGSGHAYKFLPVIGEKVVDALEERLEGELRDLWTWTETATGTETRNEKFRNGAGSDTDDEEDLFDGDGSRSGERRLNLREELARMRKDGSSRGSVL